MDLRAQPGVGRQQWIWGQLGLPSSIGLVRGGSDMAAEDVAVGGARSKSRIRRG